MVWVHTGYAWNRWIKNTVNHQVPVLANVLFLLSFIKDVLHEFKTSGTRQFLNTYKFNLHPAWILVHLAVTANHKVFARRRRQIRQHGNHNTLTFFMRKKTAKLKWQNKDNANIEWFTLYQKCLSRKYYDYYNYVKYQEKKLTFAQVEKHVRASASIMFKKHNKDADMEKATAMAITQRQKPKKNGHL